MTMKCSQIHKKETIPCEVGPGVGNVPAKENDVDFHHRSYSYYGHHVLMLARLCSTSSILFLFIRSRKGL